MRREVLDAAPWYYHWTLLSRSADISDTFCPRHSLLKLGRRIKQQRLQYSVSQMWGCYAYSKFTLVFQGLQTPIDSQFSSILFGGESAVTLWCYHWTLYGRSVVISDAFCLRHGLLELGRFQLRLDIHNRVVGKKRGPDNWRHRDFLILCLWVFRLEGMLHEIKAFRSLKHQDSSSPWERGISSQQTT